MNKHYVYILASKKNGTLYIGVTKGLQRRVYEHKNDIIKGFTSHYSVHNLVYYEGYDDYWEAANREKRLKNWKRQWKIDLIESVNYSWGDLYVELFERTGS